jgi:DNA helicase-2/ATP-dependent DNA helicase PcrA
MTTTELLTALDEMPGRDIDLTDQQEAIIKHPGGPGIVTAGPGSGKTEVLTLLLLRLLFVEEEEDGGEDDHPIQEEPVPAESIFITTYTEKAAENLKDRVATYQSYLSDQDSSVSEIDISQLRIGTLHELCNDLMQEYSYPDYENVRLTDRYEQSMLLYEHHSMVRNDDESVQMPFWEHFDYMFRPYEWQDHYDWLPNKWDRAEALQILFNRIVQDRVSVSDMRLEGGVWEQLADAYEEYVGILNETGRCDFAHLLAQFLDFLDTPYGKPFLNGTEEQSYDGVQWVLVDEYQDTNRIQERIYFKLADREGRNLIVVGDDDQALYRFRGGSVECMVTFEDACDAFFSGSYGQVTQYPLSHNFRSHPQIVDFFDDYIDSFDVMDNGRIQKPSLTPRSEIGGDYPAVGILEGDTLDDLGREFAELVRDLVENGVVEDPNQCCLLLKTTKESSQRAGPFVEALESDDIALEAYNPRGKDFSKLTEVEVLMGALLEILDPGQSQCPRQDDLEDTVTSWAAEYRSVAPENPKLENYVETSKNRIQNLGANTYLNYELLEIAYFILSLPPFTDWKEEPHRRRRLGKVTQILEAFQSTPVPGHPDLSRGDIKTGSAGEIMDTWLYKLYHVPIGYLVRSRMDDVEMDEAICPSGMVPIMTIHQSKGLEFPFVFVGTLTERDDPGKEHYLESELSQFLLDPERRFSYESAEDRARRDLVRKYYVAQSRAQYGLVLAGSSSQIGKDKVPMGPHANWLQRNVLTL